MTCTEALIVARAFPYPAMLWLLATGGNLVIRFIYKTSGISSEPAQTNKDEAAPVTPPPAPFPSDAIALMEAATVAVPARTSGRAEKTAARGRYIGDIERVLIAIGLLAGSWQLIASVIALKAVARFKELDQQLQAEYFLVGSLASILWAIIISLVAVWYDQTYGFHLVAAIKALLPEAK